MKSKYVAILKEFGLLFAAGMVGVVLLSLSSVPLIRQQLASLPPEVTAEVPPIPVLLLLQGLQSAVLLAIAILIGIACAHRVGLRSHLVNTVLHRSPMPNLATEIKWSLGLGLSTAAAVQLLDRLMAPALPEALRATNTEPNLFNTVTAIFYGGITEEILVRWGLMSLFAWALWKLLRWGVTLPSPAIYKGAILLAAILFGLLHLPLTAAIAPLTPLIIVRALLLNGIVGVAYGWLFWRHSLEAAMLAHASFHLIAFCVSLVTSTKSA
jgi:hypothetical protein